MAHFCDKAREKGKGDKRKAYSLIAAAAVGVGCILVCLDCLGGAGISPFNILGMNPENGLPCGATVGWTSLTAFPREF